MGQFKIIIDCFNKMENSTLFTSLDLGARLKGKHVEMTNVHNFVGVVFHMGVVCRDKIEKPKHRGAKFIYMKERSLTDDEIFNITTIPQCYDFRKQITKDFKKRQIQIQIEIPANQKEHDQPKRRDRMIDKRKAEQELFQYLYKRGRVADTDGKTIEPPERIYKSIQEELIDLLNISALPLTTKQIADFIGVPHHSVSTALSKMRSTPTAKKYIRKTRGGWNPCYTCDLPNKMNVTSLYNYIKTDIKIKSDTKSISRPDIINIKDRSTATEVIDDKLKVNVSFKLVKDMENLIKDQDKRVSELKQNLGKVFDENSTLTTQNKILNQRVAKQTEVDFDMDLSKYQDNLQQ